MQTFEPTADVVSFDVSNSIDKIGLRTTSNSGLLFQAVNPLTSQTISIQANPQITMWSVEQARELVDVLRESIRRAEKQIS